MFPKSFVMNFRFLTLYLLSISQYTVRTTDEASFYGGSYISIPFKEARSSTDIHFKFRTHLANALIFLVAGTTDYCIIRLDNSRLRLNINLGAGESELLSTSTVKLDDFKWHEVFIVRKEANLSVIIDSIYTINERLPGKFFELNVNYGLFVGGRGNYSELFFGHADKFRGCLAEVMYNGIMVLEQARYRQLPATVHGVTWNCAAEFSASINDPISFVEDNSFMSIAHKPGNNQVKIFLELKTIVENSTLLYNSGPVAKPDYFALELEKGFLKCTLKHNEKSLQLSNTIYVSDGFWHKLVFRITQTSMDLTVDNSPKSIKKARNHIVELSDSFYIGGMEVNKRSRAIIKGLKTADSAFKGCLKHLTFNEKPKGLPDALITEALLPGCVWQYPCLDKPCSETSKCIQQGLDSFRCNCQEEHCINPNYTQGYKVFANHATRLELIALKPLEVLEGGSTLITDNNLHVILDYPKYGIRTNAITFRILEGPVYGSLTIDVWRQDREAFTLDDVARDKVHYVHDGSENHLDHIMLEVEFAATESYILPAYLQGRFRFTLAVNVVPVNDPPVLDIPNVAVIRLAQGTRLTLDGSVIKAIDPDTEASHLVFKVTESGSGHFEYLSKPDVPISSFTQEDLLNERVAFVHHKSASKESHLKIEVSDGIETSAAKQVRVTTFPQHWRLQNNTGLVLKHFSSAIVTPYNLSFVSNVEKASDDAQFQVVQSPQFGVVEVEREFGVWINAVVFSSIEIKQHRVRYRHVTGQPDFDEFQFKSSLNASVTYTFRITFAKCLGIKGKSVRLVLNGDVEGKVGRENLEYQTEPIRTETTSLLFVVDGVPKYGYLFSTISKYKLKVNDSFTQEDIASGNIKYSLYRKSYSFVEDIVFFTILAPGCTNSNGNFTIIYYPDESTSSDVYVRINRMQVEEGGNITLTSTQLVIKTQFTTELIYNITELPKNGYIQVSQRNSTNYFTSKELNSNLVNYIHDNSEFKNDSFTFLALSPNKKENFQYVGTFVLDINLKNDNSPTRIVDKVFQVVVGGTRLLTGEDLRYVDPDLDTDTSDIIYTCQEISNGELYNARNSSVKLTQFTQRDLDEGDVLFRHSGPENGKMKLWVTDGQFYVNGILEVQASAPFIRVYNNRKLMVQAYKSAVITKRHLSYSTNLFASSRDISYEVTKKPSLGKIVDTTSSDVLSEFTQEDVNYKRVSYLHVQNKGEADEVEFRVRCRDAINVAQLGIWILPASYWEPLLVKNCKQLTVEESTSALITKHILQVFQKDVPPSAIVYHVQNRPENGYISIMSPSQHNANVMSFSQDLINEDRIAYIQSTANETYDRIVLNVTNGVVWLNGLTIDVQIIPERIYLNTNQLTVNEGGSTSLTADNFVVITDYYKDRVNEYVLIRGPEFGCLQINKKCVKLTGFTHNELLTGAIQYANDGSENLEDRITVAAVAEQKRSLAATLIVNILPVNDQKPVLVNNTGLVMWEGGTSVITNAILAATDDDLPKETLTFNVLRCWWGNVSLLSDPSIALQSFTQELIDRGQVAFRHQSGPEAQFTFNISDGLHTSKEHIFQIKTKPVSLKLYSKPLHIFPFQKKFLTNSNLLTIVSDPNRTITYKVTKPPSLGRLMTESDNGRAFKMISTFTQHDLNNTKIFYEHTHPSANLRVEDTFVFSASAHLAEPLLNKVFKVEISVSSGGLDAYVSIPSIEIAEGGASDLILNLSGVVRFLEEHAGVEDPIIQAVIFPPKHGQIYLKEFSNYTSFTQEQLESGQVRYKHDHSDTLGDNIYFSLFLLPRYIPLCNLTVPIIVTPINDQVFKLITVAPHITVVQGENHTITRSELLTEDPDTVPEELTYSIITNPIHGKLLLLPSLTTITAFTQADINNDKLLYIHNGSGLTDQFHLSVRDGKFNAEFFVFNVRVVPVYVNVTIGLPLYLQQGSTTVFVTEKQFFVDTNADRSKVQYSVQRKPNYGFLYVREVSTFEFVQSDLWNRNVRYMQSNMTASNDSFQVFVSITSGNMSVGNEVEVTVKVQPLIQLGNFTAIVGKNNEINTEVLDATSLAKLTDSNPCFTILRPPRFGQIRKIIRSSGEQRDMLNNIVWNFTHEEIRRGRIFFVIKTDKIPYEGYPDHIIFELSAAPFQPAVGDLRVLLKTSVDTEIRTLADPDEPAGHEGDIEVIEATVTSDYFLIVSIVAGIVVIGIIILLIVKCRSLEADEMKKDDKMAMPLPRPPDRLLISGSPLKQDGYASPIPSALPHCKVTPLNRNDLDTQTRYPYGVDEHPDDWSSCDASDFTCPNRSNIMLRRNQYWV